MGHGGDGDALVLGVYGERALVRDRVTIDHLYPHAIGTGQVHVQLLHLRLWYAGRVGLCRNTEWQGERGGDYDVGFHGHGLCA